MHMVRIKAREGQHVKRGEVIGWVGSTGASTGRIDHYEVHINGTPVDPVYFFYNDLNAEQYDRGIKNCGNGKCQKFLINVPLTPKGGILIILVYFYREMAERTQIAFDFDSVPSLPKEEEQVPVAVIVEKNI